MEVFITMLDIQDDTMEEKEIEFVRQSEEL